MRRKTRFLNVTTGFWLNENALKMAFDSCAVGWATPGDTVRSLSREEAIEARNEQAKQAAHNAWMAEIMPLAELHGLKFSPPKTTYSKPSYDAMELPLIGHRCRWPRSTQFAEAVAWEPGMVGV